MQYIQEVLHNPAILDAFKARRALPSGYGFRIDARAVEIPWTLAHLSGTSGAVLDAGSSLNFQVVLDVPSLSQVQLTILTLAPEKNCFWRMGISYVFGDLRRTVFRDEIFDSVVCISTIEHVGMDNRLYAGDAQSAQRGSSSEFLLAIGEFKRLLKPGGSLYITFPFGRYEDHGWFQQFDAALMDTLIGGFSPTQITEAIYQYLPTGWELSDRTTCAQCEFFDVRTSKYFNPSSTIEYPSDYPAAERAVACLRLVK
jgi:SAM-dependent methyltransferase